MAIMMMRMIKQCADVAFSPFGYALTRKEEVGRIDHKANGFPGYVDEAHRAGMDVNDWEEEKLGWAKGLPILEQTIFPYLRDDNIVCNLGPGTGRWARHIVTKLTKGELHLVDYSPWMVNFLREYFHSDSRIHIHLNDGYSLVWHGAWMDLIFSFGTFIALQLGHIYIYSREFFRVLRPGGYCVIEYLDISRSEGWNWLEIHSNKAFAGCYTYHVPDVIEKVFSSAGFEIVKSLPIGRSTFLITRKLTSKEESIHSTV
jgi:hypothetical protein